MVLKRKKSLKTVSRLVTALGGGGGGGGEGAPAPAPALEVPITVSPLSSLAVAAQRPSAVTDVSRI